jgi:hypothetical protein
MLPGFAPGIFFAPDYSLKIQIMRKIFIFLWGLISIATASAQTTFEPLDHDVYNFLSILSQKGIVEFNDQIKPLPRSYLFELLSRAESDSLRLTAVEKSELKFFLQDYRIEKELRDDAAKTGSHYTVAGKDPSGRLRLFQYSDSRLKMNLSPVFGYEIGRSDSKKANHSWSGINFYGYLNNHIGFSFYYRDNAESGEGIDFTKSFTSQTGIVIAKSDVNKIEYSEVKTSLSYDWQWGAVTVGNGNFEWGYGESGKLVLSTKAPCFPYIRLDVNPVSWLNFNYIHAWLNSDVVDSSEVYRSLRRGSSNDRIIYREKYYASHTITLLPVEGLSISLGESVIYSDKLEVAYLQPLMFFRLADHYLSEGSNNAGSNSQFFLGVSSRNHIKNTHLYGTWFIDEFTLEGAFDKQKQRNQFGFTLGGSVADLPVENLKATVEFTKIYPFVYRHYIPTQTYENSSYTMGHWMGHNADLIYGALDYRVLRGLEIKAWAEKIRKGGDGIVDQQYTQPQPPFLFGPVSKYLYLGFEAKYELTHELFARLKFCRCKVEKENLEGGSDTRKYNEFYFAMYYGL